MTLMRLVFALLVLWFVPLFAQDYSVPSQWNTSSPLSLDQRIHLFQGALEAVNTSYDETQGLINMSLDENANLVSAIAIFDRIVSGRDNYDAISEHISRVRPKLIPLSMWGLTEIYSYRAYSDNLFLLDAKTIWEQYTPWMITIQDAENGSHPLKNVTFPSQCNGASVAGGVFVYHEDEKIGSLAVIASTQGAYMACVQAIRYALS
ncbi:hypothetical protein QCA50_008172 [Cerrena zonata]|uniref:Uncharacterized protein n=1 Tax=Cerrena zonata TaxID=2478898 RepID=A0AAW0GAJ3_9APHY